MIQQTQTAVRGGVEINKVLRNTYMLLAMTLAVSAMAAGVAMAMEIGRMASLGLSIGALVLLFVTLRKAEGASGLIWIFAFTAMEGASLGYILNHYVGMANGPGLIMQALGLTSVVFFGLSAYCVVSKKDFSFMGGFLFAGLIVVLVVSLANMFFFQSSATFMAMQGAIALLMTGLILFDTSRIVNGGETNYIRATVALYLDFLNLFLSLLHLLGFSSDD